MIEAERPATPMDMDALEAEALAAAVAETTEGLDGNDLTAGTSDTSWMSTSRSATVPASSDGSPTARAVVCALGLVSVASVSAFKRMLARNDGVHAVHVTSGPQGEFMFTLTCDPGLDLGAVVAGLPGFKVELRNVAEGRVDVVAHELNQPS